MTKVLCLYLTIGSGHRIAAESVAEALRAASPAVEVLSLDLVDRTWAGFTPLLDRAAALSLRLAPRAYDRAWRTGSAGPLMNRLVQSPPVQTVFAKYLAEFQPQAVVSTHAFPCSVTARLKRSYPALKVIGVVTDFGVHQLWPTAGVDRYCVPGPEAAQALVARGVRPDQIVETGIPISPSFIHDDPDRDAVTALGLRREAPVVLVVAGAGQLGPYVNSVRQALRLADGLDDLPGDAQVIIVAGENARLKSQLERRTAGVRRRVRVLGYTHAMPALMQAATLIVSKPGGLIAAEALAAGVPFVILCPGPGQETANAEYLIAHDAGVQAQDGPDAVRLVTELLRDDDRRRRMAERARRLGKPLASRRAAEEILDLLVPQVKVAQ